MITERAEGTVTVGALLRRYAGRTTIGGALARLVLPGGALTASLWLCKHATPVAWVIAVLAGVAAVVAISAFTRWLGQ